MKLFRAATTVEGRTEKMVDWYDVNTEEEARVAWDEDRDRYGLPPDKTTVEFVECNPETLKPV